MSTTRYQRFRMKMIMLDLKWGAIAQSLGLSVSSSVVTVQRETIKREHYEKLLALGFEKELLPTPTK